MPAVGIEAVISVSDTTWMFVSAMAFARPDTPVVVAGPNPLPVMLNGPPCVDAGVTAVMTGPE